MTLWPVLDVLTGCTGRDAVPFADVPDSQDVGVFSVADEADDDPSLSSALVEGDA